MNSLAYSVINFSILVGILAYKLRAPIKEFVTQRYQTIRTDIHSASEKLQGAKKQHHEFTEKLKSINEEVSQLRKQSQTDANQLKEKMTSETRHLAQLVQEDARKAAAGMQTELKTQLLLELSSKVFERAESLIQAQLPHVNRDQIKKEFSSLLETTKV